ncbi:ribosome maturation factor RimP [Parafrankia colletiae]|uniref:Ribosome maturation factor RimP n=1 Tax=Parafrankia colletiae TaxID=573497 RepID=A0A1S1RDE8_9ACTN|nr:ribosome maturation factor RimP [Parafrankia colletiae]MCK9898587.1 ribosome maturation factor RimP [Frankia sp. Cpl3]OHV44066.1 ribosome maturation factor RimP [Parafrankia colletiae]
MARTGDSGRAGVRRPTAPSRGTGRTQASAGGGRAAAAAANEAARVELRRRLEPALAAEGFDLEDVAVSRAGSRSVVRVAVDREGGIDLDAVAAASRLVSAALDDEAEDGAGGPLAGPYVLEVTSPGVDRPLLAPRHWRRAVGRVVLVRRSDGGDVEGRVLSADDEGADLAVPTGPARRGRPARTRVERVVYGTVTRATVQVEFGSAADADQHDREAGGDTVVGPGDVTDTDLDDSEDFDDADDSDDTDDFDDVDDAHDSDDADGVDDPRGVAGAATAEGGVGGVVAAEAGHTASHPDELVQDHGAVGAVAGPSGRDGKEMNR